MKQTQLDFVVETLEKTGEISRNYCLRNYLSRLGARIVDLKKKGWQFETERRKTEWGEDYVYRVVGRPELKLF